MKIAYLQARYSKLRMSNLHVKGDNSMDAKIRKIAITPAKFDENGDIKTGEYATVTLDVPMDSTGQRQAIIELMTLLDKEWVKVRIQSDQQLDMGAGTTTTSNEEAA